MQPTLEPTILNTWVGKTEQRADCIRPQPANFMRATLDLQRAEFQCGDGLPPAWHWLYFLEARPARELGRDGHPRLGGFLPPVALPRRMWAGSRMTFVAPIHIGERLTKHSRITAVTRKRGSTGELCFVTVLHELRQGERIKLSEEHDIVYREDPTPGQPAPPAPDAPADADIEQTIEPNSTLLFRYSALTFNGHRIHYDLEYARQVEGYPGLVVHAPLTATLLLALAQTHLPRIPIEQFRFRAVSPLFHSATFKIGLQRQPAQTVVWAANNDGKLAMLAHITP